MKWIFGVIFFWLTFVVSLTTWWLYFGITTLSKAAETSGIPSQLARHQRMLFMEGSVLVVFLFSGGLALFYFAYRMYKEKSAKEMFFASFAHDLKTALFRMQLEIEKLGKTQGETEVDPLMGHARKMHLDLENALDSTIGHNKKMFIEEISLKNFLLDLHTQWPEFHIKFSGEDKIRADRKALHSIFKNLLHNSFVHGEANEVSVELTKKSGRHQLLYRDNGQAFDGDINQLGKATHYTSGGSGFGLFIVKQWVLRLGGKIQFNLSPNKAIEIAIELPGGGA